MQEVTRERSKVDRIACPWLIRRFVLVCSDDQEQLTREMLGYDALCAYWRQRVGNECSALARQGGVQAS